MSRHAIACFLAAFALSMSFASDPRAKEPDSVGALATRAVANTVADGLYMDGVWVATYGTNYSTVQVTLPFIYNDSFTYTTGTLRMSYWATTTAPARGVGFTGYRLATFSTLAALPPRTYYSDIVRNSSMAVPPNGTYWLILALEEYDPANCSASDGYCLVDSLKSDVQRTFGAALPPLIVTRNGTGSGTVTSTPGGINCGATCSAPFNPGTIVTLAATPLAGSTFAGWSGACVGLGNCVATVNIATNVTATFTSTPVTTTSTRSDFNADGKSDILYRNATTGQVYRLLMNGFSVTSGAMAYLEPNTAWKIIGEGDFNGDGTSDLLWRHATGGQVFVQTFASSGFPNGGATIATEPNSAWKIIHTPDLDGDGRADILWWNSGTGSVYAMLMNGGSIKAEGFVYTEPNTTWKIVAVGDFSGSGRQNQLVWRNTITGQVYLMTVGVSGNAFSATGSMIYHEPNTSWKIIAAADFDGDGKSDLLWRNDITGHVYMMLMNGAAISGGAMVYQEPDLAWKIVAQGDYNGDRKADLLWRNEVTGQVYMMLMSGVSIGARAMVYQEPNTAWKVLGPWEYGVDSRIYLLKSEDTNAASTFEGRAVNEGSLPAGATAAGPPISGSPLNPARDMD